MNSTSAELNIYVTPSEKDDLKFRSFKVGCRASSL